MKLHKLTFILLVIGGLNWLLEGIFGAGISSYIPEGAGGGMGGWLTKTIYILVGLSAIYEIVMHKSTCKMCEKGMMK